MMLECIMTDEQNFTRCIKIDKIMIMNTSLNLGMYFKEAWFEAKNQSPERKIMAHFDIVEGVLNKYEGIEQDIIVPEGVHTIAAFAFYQCDTLIHIQLPQSLITIHSYAFYGCEQLQKIHIPDTVTFMGPGVFSCCSKLESVILPQGLHTLAKSLFYRCFQLQNILLPSSLRFIDHSAFGFCQSLKSIHLPHHITTIPMNAFINCLSLQEVELPSQLERIEKKAFYQCPQLHTLTLPQSVTHIEQSALQTLGPLTLISHSPLLIQPLMFDENWRLTLHRPDGHNYQFEHCFFPNIDISMWKPQVQLILLSNFLETYTDHPQSSLDYYLEACQKQKSSLLAFLIKNKKYTALHQAMEIHLFQPDELEPYFDDIQDREEKAKLMTYSQKTSDHLFDDLTRALDDLF